MPASPRPTRQRVFWQLTATVLVVAFVFAMGDNTIRTYLGMTAMVLVSTSNLWFDPLWSRRKRPHHTEVGSSS